MAAIDKKTSEEGAEKAFGGGNIQEILFKHDKCCQVAKKIDLKLSESTKYQKMDSCSSEFVTR